MLTLALNYLLKNMSSKCLVTYFQVFILGAKINATECLFGVLNTYRIYNRVTELQNQPQSQVQGEGIWVTNQKPPDLSNVLSVRIIKV